MQLTAINTGQHFIQAFSWMLIHSLWLGLLLSVVVGLLLMLSRRSSATLRYNLVLSQLLLFVIACATTFVWEWDKTPVESAVISFRGAAVNDAASVRAFVNTCISYFTVNSPVIVLLWFILFLVRTVRMMGSAIYINRARHRFIYQPSDAWKAKVNILCEKLQLKRAVQLLESGYVNVPMVIGHLKPVILIPIGLLAGLPAGQVEAVLLHELAHIRRNDYVVNCLQTIVETVFFFNPGLLWISSVLRDERENCCDDIALSQTKNKKEFVQALISFKEYALERKSYAVNFPGNKNGLLNRASRILYNKNKPLGTGEKAFFLAGILVLSIIAATASLAQMHTANYEHRLNSLLYSSHKNIPAPTNPAPPPPPPLPVKPNAKATLKTDTVASSVKNNPAQIQFGSSTQYRSAAQIQKVLTSIQAKQNDMLPADPQKLINDQLAAKHDQEAKARDQQSVQDNLKAEAHDKDAAKRDHKSDVREQAQAKSSKTLPNDAANMQADQQQAVRDQMQAMKDQEQSKKDEAQANMDQVQANRDHEQAIREQIQGARDRQPKRLPVEQGAHMVDKSASGRFQKWDGQSKADMQTNSKAKTKEDTRLYAEYMKSLQAQKQQADEASKQEQMLKRREEMAKTTFSGTSVQE
jgi:bla regulator protein blaR1